jgi:hypothetical protein
LTPVSESREPAAGATPARRGKAALIAVALLLLGAWMPGDLKSAIESRLWGGIPWSAAAHFFLFAVIAAVPVYGSGWKALAQPLALAAALALLTETVQRWVPGRHPLLRDALIDVSGALAGLSLSYVVRALARRSRPGLRASR